MRQCLVEFCGADHLKQATAVYLTHTDGCAYDRRELRPPTELDWFLERRLDIALHKLVRACEAAALMGCDNIVLHPGPEREGRRHQEEFLQRMHRAADSLNRVATRCCELGIQLLLETMLPHLLFGHVRNKMHLLGKIRACTVGTCLDTDHAHLAGEMATVTHKLSGHLNLVHANDNRGDRDAHLPPGEGQIGLAWVAGELRRADFHVVLVLELSSGEHEPVEDMLERAVRAREHLDRVCAGLAG